MPDISAAIADKAAKTVQIPATDGRVDPKALRVWRETLLYKFGLDPKSDEAQRAIAPVHEAARWDYFEGEVEPCINGRAVAIGAYFGQDVRGIIDRLLTATTSHRSRPRQPTTLTTEPSNSRSSQTTKSPHSPGRFSAFFSRLLE